MSFAALMTDVEIDDVTGQSRVVEAWSSVDVGRAINPGLVETQIEGGFVQGLGFALFEEMVRDGARLANPSLMDYKIATSRDAPYKIHCDIVEAPEPDGPFGAKGAGEIGINPVAAAIANAISAASGFRHHHLPMTSERLLAGMLSEASSGRVSFMRIEDYPAQEPFTEIGEKYHAEVLARNDGPVGVDYFYGTNPYQSLLVFSSAQPNGNVLCVMHGGGWTNGYKEWMAFMVPALTNCGVTFVSLGYRLAPNHIFPVGYEDCCDGIAWVHRNISSHSGDPGRIFVGGHSAGGHHAALLALRQDGQAPRQLPVNVIKGAWPALGCCISCHFVGAALDERS